MKNDDMGINTERIADTDIDGETWTGNGAGVILLVFGGAALVVLVFVMRLLGLI